MTTLVLEVEYLSGVSFAAVGPDSDVSEWPPQPDRLFSALVAAWAARGESEGEREALAWLEEQEPPSIDASAAADRTAPVAFVPPNDPRGDRKGTALQVIPDRRRRQPRRFPAVRPRDAIVRLYWQDVEVGSSTVSALDAIARDVAYVGHSASLTRCRFAALGGAPEARHRTTPPRRRVYPGRLEELRRAFDGGRRPLSGAPVTVPSRPGEQTENVFDDRWLILECVDGTMPDIRAVAYVARSIRDTILSGYGRIGLDAAIPERVSGHTPAGDPSSEPHMAVVPMAFVGFPQADGHVMGFALVPPRSGTILDDEDFRRALRSVAPMDQDEARRVMTVRTKRGTPREAAFSVRLSPSFEAPTSRLSLDPRLYLGPARDYATVTPLVLDRHLKAKGEEREHEIREQVARACRNVGLPEPEAVHVDKHSTHEGVPSAYPSGNAPAWTRWRLPHPIASRQLTHAFVRFPEAVSGPVILGAGRYVGLGLCRPVRS